MARWCVGEESECNGPDCGHAEDCLYYHELTQDDWERKVELEKRKEDMEHTDDTGKPGHDSIASVCRDMREAANVNEKLGFYDLRNLSTDSLRGWADFIEETSESAKIDEDTSDGYHTFRELYRYRMLYNAAFFNMLARHTDIPVVKSHRHGDGELCFGGGWFIVSAQLPTGQVSNHYEDRFWELFDVPEVEKAPEWDGHTPNDAADRIEVFLKTRRPENPESGGNAAMCEALGSNENRKGESNGRQDVRPEEEIPRRNPMNNTNETIAAAEPGNAGDPLAAILAEMRDERIIRLDDADVTRCLLRNLADRIESAVKSGEVVLQLGKEAYKGMQDALSEHDRLCEMLSEFRESIGNAAAMHEALEEVQIGFDNNVLGPIGDRPNDWEIGEAKRLRIVVDSALAAPPRNCDVGTVEEQMRRKREYCKETQCSGCPANKGGTISTDRCDFTWAQMPFDSRGKCGDAQ